MSQQLHLPVVDYARSIGAPRQQVYLWIKTGRLEARKLDGIWYVAADTPRPVQFKRGRKKHQPVLA